ncbi:Aste57867_2299 [Aphanomyces stellatus]|uniref:Aste57867_2299 protein n=1 Tax=Aphanomyces stellatus TaxID=120398 RepID=A0A485K7C9_9STRA|nr:hypothetical protein As57867_002294 [Aphanomyces stellatus]VFT79502.1 Aste57867_2299 [Aphanomyces stellatus]
MPSTDDATTALFVGQYNRRPVTIQALNHAIHVNQAAVNRLADAIGLHAKLSHPNIVAFVGFACLDATTSLVAVTEFLPQGTGLFLGEAPGLA